MARPHRVSWHKTGRWSFSATIAGARRRFYAPASLKKTAKGRHEATRWMEDTLATLVGQRATGPDYTLAGLADAYLEAVATRVATGGASPETYRGHRKHLSLMCAALGEVRARDLTTGMLADLVARWRQEGKGATTIRNRIASLQACLNWSAESRSDRAIPRLIAVNPVAGFELPRAEYRGDRHAPAGEVDAFLAWIEARAALDRGKHGRFSRLTARLVRFVAETGCRPGEACRLEWRHIDPEKRLAILPPGEHKTGRKTGRARAIVLSPNLVSLLEEIRADPARHPVYVFTHRVGAKRAQGRTPDELFQGDPWNSNALSRRIKELRREAIRAGVLSADAGVRRMHLYRLRHTYATNAVQAGLPLTDVAALLGNSAKITESTYLHTQADHLHEAAEKARGGSRIKDQER